MRISLGLILLLTAWIGGASPSVPSSVAAERKEEISEKLTCFRRALAGLQSPEVEAKLSVPDEATLRRIKKLVGKKITVRDSKGAKRTYDITLNKQHIYKDTYYDIRDGNDLLLFKIGGLLRVRERWDLKPKTGKYKLAKVVIQAKNRSVPLGDEQDAINVRSEIRGVETLDRKAFYAALDRRLGRDSEDPAVQYAFRLLGSAQGKFIPVLYSPDERFFLKLTPRGKSDAPSFYLSADSVKNRGLVGQLGSGIRREVEIEVIEDLSTIKSKRAAKKVYLLDQINRYIAEKFGLTPSQESKYEGGVYDTVLPPEDEEGP